MKSVRVIELFAGVGGFRVGLNKADADFFKTIWANQWEPATKVQHAAMVYEKNFGAGSVVVKDINQIHTSEIPNHDMLVGGFPCQDYSVATTLNNSKGINGKKGVLWWAIYRILKEKGDKRPEIVFLENVDRLLLSPASQRGRDFAIILECLNELGYIVEWRVINAAEYAMPQRRRRTYIIGYKKEGIVGKQFTNPKDCIFHTGIFAKAFPIQLEEEVPNPCEIALSEKESNRLMDITNEFNKNNKLHPFEKSGVMLDGRAYTINVVPLCNERQQTIKDIMVKPSEVSEEFYVSNTQVKKWEDLRGKKSIERTKKNGIKYIYAEGKMDFPDPIDKPSRTIITSEGGKSPDRCRHIIIDETNRYRRLVPVELERLNMFPDNHTKLEGVSDGKRAFLMGNALVCGIVTKVGKELESRLKG